MKYLCLLLLLLIIPPATALSLGVSPSRILHDNLLPGSSVEEIILLNKNGEESVRVRVDVHGEAAAWITHPSLITLPAQEKNLQIPLLIEVPPETPLGEYKATINYVEISQATVHIAFSTAVHLVVTDEEDRQYHVKHVQVEQEGEETRISYEVHNKGNIPSGPATIAVEIRPNGEERRVYAEERRLRQTAPFTIAEEHVAFATELETGNYWVAVKLAGEQQEHNDLVFLEVMEGSITGRVAAAEEGTEGFPAGAAVIALLMVTLFISFKRRKGS